MTQPHRKWRRFQLRKKVVTLRRAKLLTTPPIDELFPPAKVQTNFEILTRALGSQRIVWKEVGPALRYIEKMTKWMDTVFYPQIRKTIRSVGRLGNAKEASALAHQFEDIYETHLLMKEVVSRVLARQSSENN